MRAKMGTKRRITLDSHRAKLKRVVPIESLSSLRALIGSVVITKRLRANEVCNVVSRSGEENAII